MLIPRCIVSAWNHRRPAKKPGDSYRAGLVSKVMMATETGQAVIGTVQFPDVFQT